MASVATMCWTSPDHIRELYQLSWNLVHKYQEILRNRPYIYPAIWDSEGRPTYLDYRERYIMKCKKTEGAGYMTYEYMLIRGEHA